MWRHIVVLLLYLSLRRLTSHVSRLISIDRLMQKCVAHFLKTRRTEAFGAVRWQIVTEHCCEFSMVLPQLQCSCAYMHAAES